VAFSFGRGLIVLFIFAGISAPASSQTVANASRAVEARIVRAIDEGDLVRLKGNTHRLARTEFDQGVAPASLAMDRLQLVLTRSSQQDSDLKALLEAQQDKASSEFHQWLTPEQFGNRFGPSDSDIQMVTSWLQSHGFQVSRIAKGRTAIEFSGTAGQVSNAFHTEIHKYAVNGEEKWANASDPQIPTALAPVVAGAATLHNFRAKSMANVSNKWPVIQKPWIPAGIHSESR
jgi:subtilase family serine protease